MLFLKRLSDEFDRKRRQLRQQDYAHLKGQPKLLAELLEDKTSYGETFFVPKRARWHETWTDENGEQVPALQGPQARHRQHAQQGHRRRGRRERLPGRSAEKQHRLQRRQGEDQDSGPEVERPAGPLQPAALRPGQRQLRVPRPAGRGLRVPHQVLRRQRRQEGRRVLHAGGGGAPAGAAHQTGSRQPDLRPRRRLRRISHPVPPVRRGAGAERRQSGPLWAGLQRHHLVHLQHEHDPPQRDRLRNRERRHAGGPADPGERPDPQVRPRAGQSPVLAELQPRQHAVHQPLPRVVPGDRQEGRPHVRPAHAGQPQGPTDTWPPSCPTACSSAAARKSSSANC